MSSPHDAAEPQDQGDLANRLIDEDAPAVSEESLTPQQRRRAAEIQLLHGLLRHVHAVGDPAAQQAAEVRIQGVLAGLQNPASVDVMPAPRAALDDGRGSRLRRWSAFATAAALLLAVGFWWLSSPANAAFAAVQRAQAAALELTDRLYRLTLEGGIVISRRAEAKLYVRGGDRFALQLPAPLGHFWIGRDGSQVWSVPSVGPILVGEDPQRFAQWLPREAAELPFLQVTTVLQRMADHYELEGPLPAEPVCGRPVPCPHIRGRRREAAPLGPLTIDLWYHPQTGVAERLVLNWDNGDAEPRRPWKTLTLERQDSPPVAGDFYSHAAHHGPGRLVRRVP